MKSGRKVGSAEKWRLGKGSKGKSLRQRFEEKVDKLSDSECWLWKAYIHPSGYGVIRSGDGMEFSHRISWKLEYGDIPDGLYVLHTCDNRACVNPSHLFLGTYKDNAVDRDNKKRGSIPNNKGSNHGLSKLVENDVVYILTSDASSKELAIKYGISPKTINKIRRRKSWKHVIV